MKRHIIIYMAACVALPAMAQEKLEGTLNVEGDYIPTVVRQDKIHLLPQKVSFELPALRTSTAQGLLTGDYAPGFSTLPAPVWRGELAEYPWRGYLDLGLGSYLNSTLSAGYRVADTESTRADVWLQHNSTSLFHPRMSEYGRDWKRYAYDERVGVSLRQSLGGSGTLSGTLGYHLGLFNYYGAVSHTDDNAKAPKQTLNDVRLRLGWQSSARGSWDFGLRAEGGYFGYRRSYGVADYVWHPYGGQYEIQAGLGASAACRIGTANRVGVDLDFTSLSYNKVAAGSRSRSLQTLRVLPAYSYTADRFSASLGAVVDVTWGAGRSIAAEVADLDYSTVHVAPAVRLSYDGGTWGATVSATGGQRLQTLRSGYELDYYQQPLLDYVMPAFVPVEAKVRFEAKPSARFRAGLDFTYATVRHLYLGGWYMPELSGENEYLYDFDRQHCNLAGYSIGLDAEWTPLDLLTLSGRGTYQPQRSCSTTGFFNGYDRPRWTVDAEATVRPVRALSLTLGYRYRGVRQIFWGYGQSRDGQGYRLPDICNLRLGARYRISRTLSVYGSADNLLGHRIDLLPCQPMEGFNFLLGADVLF